jgi:hypothetical protein
MRRAILVAFVLAVALPAVGQLHDSVLVELQKRTGRLGKIPKHVITNEEVAASTGRISVSWGMEDTADNTATATAARPATNSPVATSSPSPWSTADAAYAARIARERAVPAPRPPAIEGSTRASYSMPQSTAQNASVYSTANSSMPQSTAQNANVGSTATSTPRQEMTPTATPPTAVPPRKVD